MQKTLTDDFTDSCKILCDKIMFGSSRKWLKWLQTQQGKKKKGMYDSNLNALGSKTFCAHWDMSLFYNGLPFNIKSGT